MATVTRASGDLPSANEEMQAAPITDSFNNIFSFLENGNIDKANVDSSSSDGIVTMDEAQTITGLKTASGGINATGGLAVGATPVAGQLIIVEDGATSKLESDADSGVQYSLVEARAGAADTIGLINGVWDNGAGTETTVAQIRFRSGDDTSNKDDGDILFFTAEAGSITQRLEISIEGSVIIGTAAIATTATDGFFYISTSAGPPTGTPTAYTGRAPIHYDTSNEKLYIYNGGWVGVTLS